MQKSKKMIKNVTKNSPKIRKDFENDIRSFLKEDYPDKFIEGIEIIDNNHVNVGMNILIVLRRSL